MSTIDGRDTAKFWTAVAETCHTKDCDHRAISVVSGVPFCGTHAWLARQIDLFGQGTYVGDAS